MTFFFRHPPPGEADDRCTHAGDYDNKNNCQEKAYAALEIIQKSPDRYISYMWYHVPAELEQQHVSVQFNVTKSEMTVIWGESRGEAFQLSTSQSWNTALSREGVYKRKIVTVDVKNVEKVPYYSDCHIYLASHWRQEKEKR